MLQKALFLLLLLGNTVAAFSQSQEKPVIAFVSDIHLQDVYGDFGENSFLGIAMPSSENATIRSMRAQLNSTRLFNENYFALIETLNQLAEQKVRYIVLPGDYTDDGQPMNVRKLQEILEDYENQNGMRFFITTGNHDPVLPTGGKAGKRDFLGANGEEVGITGDSLQLGKGYAYYSDSLNYWGYEEIMTSLQNHGFFPHQADIFWTHPFEELDYDGYDFDLAKQNSSLEIRRYKEKNSGLNLPDASYLVEPVAGIWLLALDGNIYQPAANTQNWKGSSVGFNLAMELKEHQLRWIEKLRKEADKRGKLLISFSHYPLADYNNGSSEEMKKLFGENKMQLSRVPHPEVSQTYAEAGIQIHFAGHMHQNDTELYQGKNGQKLLNIQVPSLAAFPPAYKTLDWNSPERLLVQTHKLDEVTGFDTFFDLYRREHDFLKKGAAPTLWNREILEAKDYWHFTNLHLEGLTRERFIRQDFPEDLANRLRTSDLQGLVKQAGLQTKNLESISGSDVPGQVIQDFFWIKNGGDLGKNLVSEDRLRFYQNLTWPEEQSAEPNEVRLFLKILSQLSQDLPSEDFYISLPDLQVSDY
ncbi:metallophosphoesterase family protein [Algoriphagus vanfongensis]|uniref:metallophosphoesterase family protein n=1 Tax=Algoriphagus vanfongensis TaxID=426371 RepID=UPI00040741E0|nr:metallophosphoesterase [Algoriphagus vanfongensis]